MLFATQSINQVSIHWDFIIGGLALFLFGIEFMGNGLKSIAGSKLRDYIDRYTSKPWKGMLVGMILTVFIQSSSATSAIAISFVRAGLMSLEQSVGIIIGANIGTTITSFLIGLKVEALALYFVFLGVLVFMFGKRKKTTYAGQILLGFGMLFFGLRLMGDELSLLGQTEAFAQLATAMGEHPILGVITGVLMTALVQSSSAMIGIVQKIYEAGGLTLTASLPLVFGSNIGTTITAVIASIGGSLAAKRAAAINVLFNVLGTVLFMFLLYPFADFIEALSQQFAIAPMMQIAIATIIRALIISLIAYPFIKTMVAFAKKIMPGEEEKIDVDIEVLDPKLAESLPSGALGVTKQVTLKMGELAADCINASRDYFNKHAGKYKDVSRQYEDAINSLDSKITEYMMQIAHESLSDTDTDDFISTLQVIKNIERVGDLTMNLNEFYELAFDDKASFSKHALNDVNEMYETVLEMNRLALSHFMEHDEAILRELLDKENYLDLVEEKARERHFKRMANNECASDVAAGVYVDILGTLERIGDHIFNIVKEADSDTHAYEQAIAQKMLEQGF
ncbi:MAG: Na/Pi cotransporter family protein [Erysipelotrichaceae bacterium]|nr:Na/Pi cotransporter family protein [Erysipelotrichaceae bacterium]MCI9311929.1 Na/Pi cotransporter family protein [Erysipelotrichaceae bacterium]